MNKWSDALQSLAPAAGQPGSGAGNVPYAPGVMSGKYPGLTQQTSDYYSRMKQSQPMQQPMQDVGGVPMPVAGQPQPGPMVWGPEQQAATLQYLMSLLHSANSRVTTTGGFVKTNEPY